MKVYIAQDGVFYRHMFEARGWLVAEYVEEADLVLFTGGADVHPSLYGEDMHPSSRTSIHRDRQDIQVFEAAMSALIPMVGICRGGQFLNVMNGGKMWQDVDNHAVGGTHIMYTNDNRKMNVSSTHHQMMRAGNDGHILGYCVDLATYKETVVDGELVRLEFDDADLDIEVLHYPDTNCVCFQPHPEYLDKEHPCQEYFFELLEEKLLCAD